MLIHTIGLHPEHPVKAWIVVEQPRDEPIRLAFDPASQTFTPTQHRSIMHVRGFRGVYGWIGGMGTPPLPHLDVMLLTHQNPRAGDILEGYICGIYFRRDGDHKLVALDVELRDTVSVPDISKLDAATYENLIGVYPRLDEGEGWYGAEVAIDYLRKKRTSHD